MIEPLELRRLLAGVTPNTATLANGILTIVGTDAADDISIVQQREALFWAGTALLFAGSLLRRHCFRALGASFTGAVQVVLYVVTLLIYLPWDRVSAAAIVMMAGGGTVFGVGLVLSIYRDRLLTLPERVRRREGLFRVLGWR